MYRGFTIVGKKIRNNYMLYVIYKHIYNISKNKKLMFSVFAVCLSKLINSIIIYFQNTLGVVSYYEYSYIF